MKVKRDIWGCVDRHDSRFNLINLIVKFAKGPPAYGKYMLGIEGRLIVKAIQDLPSRCF